MLITNAAAAASRNAAVKPDSGHADKLDSGHADTIGTTVRMRRTSWNAMKLRIQCLQTQWIPGFMASGSRPIVLINASCPRHTVLVVLM